MNSTELILNEDGSLYHIALKPGEVSDTIITVGDPGRVASVSKYFDTVELKRHKREFVTHTGTYQNKRLTVISTGIGTDNIDIVINELHSLKQMEGPGQQRLRFIRLGTSGTVRKEVPVDTVLISEAALGFDGLMHFYKWDEGNEAIDQMLSDRPELQLLPRPYAAEPHRSLIKLFTPMCDASGVTITAPGFYAPQGRQVNATAKLTGFIDLVSNLNFDGKAVSNIEMETAGIYGLASLLGHQAVSISAILANRCTGRFSKQPEFVVENMIKTALEIIVA